MYQSVPRIQLLGNTASHRTSCGAWSWDTSAYMGLGDLPVPPQVLFRLSFSLAQRWTVPSGRAGQQEQPARQIGTAVQSSESGLPCPQPRGFGKVPDRP